MSAGDMRPFSALRPVQPGPRPTPGTALGCVRGQLTCMARASAPGAALTAALGSCAPLRALRVQPVAARGPCVRQKAFALGSSAQAQQARRKGKPGLAAAGPHSGCSRLCEACRRQEAPPAIAPKPSLASRLQRAREQAAVPEQASSRRSAAQAAGAGCDAWRARQCVQAGAADSSSDDELSCHVAWSSGPGASTAQDAQGSLAAACTEARHLLQGGAHEPAVQLCTSQLQGLQETDQSHAALLEVRASALLRLQRPAQARPGAGCRLAGACSVGCAVAPCRASRPQVAASMLQAKADALEAVRQDPGSTAARQVLAEALASLGEFAGALRACRDGERLLGTKSSMHDQFVALLDRIAVLAALQGSLDGFDGRQLEVGPACRAGRSDLPVSRGPLLARCPGAGCRPGRLAGAGSARGSRSGLH